MYSRRKSRPRYSDPPRVYRKRQRPRTQQLVMVQRTLGPQVSETKYFTSFRSAVTVSTGTSWAGTEVDPSVLNTLFLPTEGADIDERVGRRVAVHRIAIRGVLTTGLAQDEADALRNPCVRLILYIDQQTNGTQAQGEEVMTAQVATTQGVATGFQNPANFGRFRVLKDKTIRLALPYAFNDAAATGSIIANDVPFKINIRFRKPLIVKFNNTNGGTIGDIVDNSFHMIAAKSATDFTTALTYTVRTYYKDP